MRPPTRTAVTDAVDVGEAWAGHAVDFDLLTVGDRQFVAHYDADRRLVVAQRTLDDADWERAVLPERVPWDSHNSLALAADAVGHLHLSGNMHVDPLVYFRTRDPLDATTFERVDALVGRDEDRVTYPRFLEGPDGGLVFMYRDGGSGDGRRLLDTYDHETDRWRRLLDVPLLDGRGEVNAYPVGPRRGPGGDYHLAWVWRDTPDAATNHDLSYARSPDLRSWTTADGTPLDLPIAPADGPVVDPVPPGGGLLNSNVALGFDGADRPVVSYQKHADGGTQVCNARHGDGWRIRAASDWDERWDFGGRGSLDDRIAVDPVRATDEGLVQPFWHADHGAGRWHLDPETLDRVATDAPWHGLPAEWRTPRGDDPDLGVQWVREGDWALRWEALPPNRDRPRDDVPSPSTLQACALSRQT